MMPPPPFGFPYFGGGFHDFSSKQPSEEKEQIPLHYQTTFGSAVRAPKESQQEAKKVI
jgi:hypothetical protein